MFYKKFAELIANSIKQRIKYLKILEVHESVLSDWKRGITLRNTPKLKILADYFGVSIEYFLE